MRYNRYITIAVLLFIIYSVYKGHSQEINHTVKTDIHALTSLKPATQTDAIPQGSYVEKKMANAMEILMQTDTGKKFMGDVIKKGPVAAPLPLSSNPVAMLSSLTKKQDLQILDTKIGDGASAICGQTVTVNDTIALPDGKIIDSTQLTHQPLSFELGKKSVIRGLEMGVLGMKKGAIRTLVVPSSLAYDNKRFSTTMVPPQTPVTISVELLSIKPSLDLPPTLPAPNDTVPGNGRIAECGDSMLVEYVITSSNGTTILDSAKTKTPLIINVNDKNIPIGIIEGVIGMHMGGTRTLTIPASMMQTIGGKPFRMLPASTYIRPSDMLQLTIHLIAVT